MSEPVFGFHVVLMSPGSNQMAALTVPPVLTAEEVVHLVQAPDWNAMISRHPPLEQHFRKLRMLARDWRVATAEEAARWIRVTEGRA